MGSSSVNGCLLEWINPCQLGVSWAQVSVEDGEGSLSEA